MGKIFRLHDTGNNTLQGWDNSAQYNANVINNITDPNGGKSKKAITSIPSPFAQIDLVRVAFEQVVKNGLDGDTKYHEIVSNALDVAQIFFEWDKFKDKFELIEWNIKNKVAELVNSNDIGHKQLGDTLNLFLVQDAKRNNFNKLTDIYLLNYKYGPKPFNIIGATSPVTLFFAPANDLSYLSSDISFGNDKAFDRGFTPLYKRDIEFHKWWWYLKHSITNFSTLFKSVDDYLLKCFEKSDQERKNQLNAVASNLIDSNYAELNFGEGGGHSVKVLQNILPIKSKNIINPNTSDFAIKTNKNIDVCPLALQPNFTRDLRYMAGVRWDRNTVVPYFDSRTLLERTLPGEGSQYPYLTTSDFLEDHLIVLEGTINNDIFFNGIDTMKDKFPLIPIKDEYFDYFSVYDLMGSIAGKRTLEVKEISAGIQIILRIPINANYGQSYVEYERTYYNSSEPADKQRNRGKIVSYEDITFAMSPTVKEADKYYLGLINSNDRNFDIECFLDNQKQNVSTPIIRDPQSKNEKSKMYLLNDNFDRLKFTNDFGHKGFVIPIMKNKSNAKQFMFAIDFGTTNTHIEYSVDGKPSQPFDIKKENAQIVYLQNITDFVTHQHIFDSDFIPEVIGENFKFPMRTSLLAHQNVNWDAAKTILEANLDFTYKKRQRRSYNKSYTGLKWAKNAENKDQIRCYIESIFVMLRNKVLCEGGDLSLTKIIWTYPNSMSDYRQTQMEEIFNEAYQTYIDNDLNNIKKISESVAPYIHFKNTENAVNNIVTVDIGGGTSDIVFAQNNEIKYITSFRFAADAIFGDAYTIGNGNNGIIKQFADKLINKIANGNIEAMYKDIKNGPSNDIASFLFSLSSHVEIKDEQLRKTIDFNKNLNSDGTQKIVFVLFYAALIYHIAKIMKDKDLGMPRHIAFSGNGSKVLSVLATNNKILVDFTKCIFKLIFNAEYDRNGLDIIYQPQSNPKESTAKGAILYMANPEKYSNVIDREVIVGGNVAGKTYKDIESLLNLNDNEIDVTETIDFFDFIFGELNNEFDFNNKFGVEWNSLEIAKELCYRDLANYMKNGIESKLDEVDNKNHNVKETLFFYPIIGVLNAIESKISENN